MQKHDERATDPRVGGGEITLYEAQLLEASRLLEEPIGYGVGLLCVAEAVKVVLDRLNEQTARANIWERNYTQSEGNARKELRLRAEKAEAQLAEAQREREIQRSWKEANAGQAEILTRTVEKLGAAKTAAEADAARRKDALVKVEAWMASEDGPIYGLWEDADICNYDNRECEWEETLAEVRDFKIPVSGLGYGTEWPVITLYREILAALEAPETAREGESNENQSY